MWDGPAWIEVRNRLVTENLDWAHGIASRVARKLPTWFSPADLMGAAEIALIKLSDQYKGYQDVPFRAFAIQRLRGSCYDAIRRREYKERGHSELSDRHIDTAPSPEALAQLAEMKGVWEHVAKLEGKHLQVIQMVYVEEFSQAEVARRLNMSEAWVSLVHAKALGMLKEMVG